MNRNMTQNSMSDKEHNENERIKDEKINELGQAVLNKNKDEYNIHLLTIIGEIEGHENLPSNSKTTKYEHILPTLAAIEDSDEIDGVLVLLQTSGGDCSAG